MGEDKINWTNSSKILVEDINSQLRRFEGKGMLHTGSISDGYHTFDELYEHRITLYIALARMHTNWHPSHAYPVWKSKVHSDGSVWHGWFLLGIGTKAGEQITYHLPLDKWLECEFATTLDKAPEFDGHTSKDVLERIKNL